MKERSKKGLDYFPVEVSLLNNYSIKRIIKKKGAIAAAVLIQAMDSIYKDEGYYADYSPDLLFGIADSLYTEEETVGEIILEFINAGIFDKDKFEKYGILTSRQVQDNYFFATKRRKNPAINPLYLIEEEIYMEKEKKDETSCIHHVNNSAQRIEENKKEKKIKKKKTVEEGEEIKKEKEEQTKNHPNVPEISPVHSNPSSPLKTPPPPPSEWRFNFKVYKKELIDACSKLLDDPQYIRNKERLYPEMDVMRTFEKIITEFWATEKGWEAKRKQKDEQINWRLTFDRQLNHPYNVIRKKNQSHTSG